LDHLATMTAFTSRGIKPAWICPNGFMIWA
jgi:hypothetical protein